jgi:CubicO group peptidase (beta-lactamase class C family)
MNNLKIEGFCDERFERVKKAFERNFKEGLDVGASFAATLNGEFVIDIWAGYADANKTKLWEKDTIVNVYSTTKIMTVLCTLMCVDRGLLNFDDPVSKYWPEFADNGKENILIRHILSHTSGVAGFEEKVHYKTLYDWEKVISLLATQKPWWEPGTKSGYHAITHGYLLGELVRRVTGKSLGTFFKEEVAKPLKADFHIGLPEAHDHRVAELIPAPPLEIKGLMSSDPNSIAKRVLMNPILSSSLTTTRQWLAAEIPAANGQGNARSVARVASILSCGGTYQNFKLLSSKVLEQSIQEQSHGKDLVLGFPMRFGLGWGLTSKEMPLGPNPRTFFWGGWGGSMVIIDLDAKLSFAFVMNKMVSTTTGDPRTIRLMSAIYRSLKK